MTTSNKFVTPKGAAVYPSLTRPDTRFSAEGVYKTGITLTAEQAQPLIDQMKEIFIEEFGQKKLAAAKWPFKENEDGSYVFNFKSKQMPKLVDANGLPVKDAGELNIGGGSTIRVAGVCKAYNAGGATGVTTYMNSVQIISLVEYNSSPFGKEDGDFVVESSKEAASDEPADVPF